MAVISGVVTPSVKAVKFYYYYDANGDGLANDSNTWTFAVDAALQTGTMNKWTATWDATGLSKGQYLLGVQAVDDNTLVDDGITPSGVDNRTFSYVVGDSQNRIYVGGTSYVTLPSHSPAMTPSSTEDWWGNPSVTGVQTALVGVALNNCGKAPTITKTASVSSVVAGATMSFTITINNLMTSSITVSQIQDTLPAGFAYSTGTTSGDFGTSNPSASGQTLTWTFGTPVSIAAGISKSLTFNVTAPATSGNYSNTATATTSFGTLTSAPVSVAVDAARISLSKTPNVYTVNPGGTVTYTLAYSNDSTVSVTNAYITDDVPTGTTFSSCSGGCTNPSGTVRRWDLGTLAAGATGSVTLTVTVNSNYSTSSLTNSATLSVTAPDNSTVTKTATSTIAVNVPIPAFTLTKTAGAVQIAPAGSVTWTITYNNYGTGAASGVTITDTLPAGFTYSSNTGGGTNSSGTVTWNIGSVAAGASSSVTVTATAAASPFTYPNPATNSTTITWTGNATGVTATNDVGVTGQYCSAVYYFHQAADNLLATIRPATTSVPTSATDYTTVISAVSNTAFDTTNQVTFQSPVFASTMDISGKTLTVNFNLSAAQGGTRTQVVLEKVGGTTTTLATSGELQIATGNAWYAFTATIGAGTTVATGEKLQWRFQFRVTGGTKDITFHYDSTVYDSRSSLCTATNPASLSLSKTVDQAYIASASGTLNYILSYSNTGGASATGVSLADTLPSNVTCSQYTSTCSNWSNVPGSCSAWTSCSGGSLTLSPGGGTLAAGASGNYAIQATVGSGASGTLTNSATLSGTGLTSATATAATSVGSIGGGTPALSLSKSSDKTLLSAGGTVTYTLTVVNTGTGAASSVVVTDALPVQSYYTYGACTTATGTCSQASNTLTWNAGTLSVGSSATLTFTMIAGSTGLPAGVTVISNTASAIATSVSSVNSNTVDVTLSGNPNLTLTKSASPSSSLNPGDTVTYTMTVTNNGSASASSVVVTDPIPSGASYKGTITASAGSGSFDAINNQVIFSVGTLAAGASATLSFQITINTPAAGTTSISITNTATASAANASSKTATASATGSATPTLTLSKSGPSQVAYPAATLTQAASSSTTVFVNSTAQLTVGQYVSIGGTTAQITAATGNTLTLDTAVSAASGSNVIPAITYNISYQNTGTGIAPSVTLTDALPAGTTFVSASNSGANSSGTVTWNIGSLSPNASGSVTVTILPGGAGTLTNTAHITCTGCTPPTDPTVTTKAGGLIITKRTTTPTRSAPGTAIWEITVENTLASTVSSFTVTDTLPGGFTYASISSIAIDGSAATASTNPSNGDQSLTWSGFSAGIPAGKKLVITFNSDIASSTGAATYQNDAGGTSTTGGVTPFDPLLTTAEDVTILAASTGILDGYIYRRNDSNTTYDAGTDTPFANVKVNIEATSGDCPNSSTTCYIVYTDSSGYYSRVLPNGTWIVTVDSTTGDLSGSGLTLVVGTNPNSVTVPDQGLVSNDNGYSGTTYTVTYNGNTNTGGTAPTDSSSPYNYNSTVTVLGNTGPLTKTGYTFASWNTAANGTGTSYAVAATFTISANTTLYAQWTINTYTVTATASGNGTGTVASNTGGISYTYQTASTGTTSALNYGTNVVLTATAGTGSTVSWTTCAAVSGTEGGTSTAATCTFSSLTANKTVAATFTSTTANGSIAGSIWYDLNHNQIRDGNEAGRSGWHVELISGSAVIATTTTDSNGNYSFAGLGAGTYTVRFINPNGNNLSSGPMPVNGENGSPVSGGGTPSLSQITNITLTAGSGGSISSVSQQSLPLDPSGVIYNSATRQPVSGATVTLLYNGSAINSAYVAGGSATQTTSSDGSYAFLILPGAPAGTYGLSVSAANYTFPSTAIPPTTAPGGFTGGAVTSISGAPQTGQSTTYYLQFNKPTTDITNNNIPLDSVQSNATTVSVPTTSEWGMLIFTLLAGLGAMYYLRRRRA